MKKIVNVITLIVMVSVNILTPFTYADLLGDNLDEIQNLSEVTQENSDFSDEENEEESGEENDENNEEIVDENREDIQENTQDSPADFQNDETETQEENEIQSDSQGSEQDLAEDEALEFYAPLVGDDSVRNNFYYKTITITGSAYTLMDRNLGARVAWNTGTHAFGTDYSSNYNTASDFYGYYYQWGNNYGFSAKTTQLNVGTVLSNAIPSNYVSTKWSNPYPSNLGYNLRGNITDTESARQGPCPRGWHVPSADEWEAIRDAWCVSAGNIEDCKAGPEFAEALQMPTAGYRGVSYNLPFYSRGSNGYYWSSTSNNSSSAIFLFFNAYKITPNFDDSTYGRNLGLSVRCLMNNTDAVTLYLNPNGGKVENAIIDADAQGKVTLPTATRDGYVFEGWFASAGESEKIGDAEDEISIEEDTDLYAHWSEIVPTFVIFNNGATVTKFEVEDGGTLTNDQIQQVSNLTHTKATFDGWYTNPEFTQAFDFNTPITEDTALYAKWTCNEGYITLYGDGGPDMNCFEYGTISYEDNNGNEHVLMDRNLGAQIVGFGYDADSKSYGYYYQWGNNYGFGPYTTPITSNTQIDCSNINPSSYSSSTFIIGSNDFDWCSSRNDNLWGGSEDGSSNNRGLDIIPTTAVARQGPCPKGWHVPSIGERQTLLIYWASGNNMTGVSDTPFYYYAGNPANYTKFQNDFKIPIAGQRAYQGAQFVLAGGGGSANLWSSSPNVDYGWQARGLNLNNDAFKISANQSSIRAYGRSVRCFMNITTKTLVLNANGGTTAENILETDDDGKVTLPIATRDADSNGERVFEGWFASSGVSEKIGNSGDEITLIENVTLYAHWAQTISIDRPSGISEGSVGFTILDRNLGAIVPWDGTWNGNYNVDEYYGYYYQRGNNHGFLYNIPAEPYNGPATIKPSDIPSKFSSDIWDTTTWNPGNNIWGDEYDTDLARQGPCPQGYHVPSSGEWQAIYDVWGNSSNKSNSESSASKNFVKDLKLPPAGFLTHTYEDNNRGSTGFYWSSTPKSSSEAYSLEFDSESILDPQAARSSIYGHPVRCFKNGVGTIYTLILNAGTGIVDLGDGAQSTVTTGILASKSFTVPAATRTDHSFDGWFIDENSNGKYDEGEVMKGDAGGYTIDYMDDDLNLTAKWKVTVTYDGNGGTSERINDTGFVGDIINLPGAIRDGKFFGGWINGGNDNVGTSGDAYTLSIIETLKALWYDYLVTFVYGDGKRAADPVFINNGDGDIELPSVSGTAGYNFDGWFDAEGNKIGDAGDSLSVHESRTLYASGSYSSVVLIDTNMTTTVGSGEVVGLPVEMTAIENDILESPVGEELSEVEGKTLAGDVTIDFGGEDAIFSHLVQINIPVRGSTKAYVKVKHVRSDGYNYDGLTRNIEASCDADGRIVNIDDMYTGKYIEVEDGYVSIYTCEASSFVVFGLPNVTFVPNNGDDAITVEVEDGDTVDTEDIPNVSRSGYNFSGWYLSGVESPFDFTGTAITGDITLYAKWTKECGDGEVYSEEEDICVESSEEQGFEWGLITIDKPSPLMGDGPVSLIIMDRNLGATMTGYGAGAETGSYGYFYQWGNNHGFAFQGDFTVVDQRINVSGLTEYSGESMVCHNNDIWMNPVNKDFWGGEGGQGPCPEGWHVPTVSELRYMYGYYTGEAGNASSLNGFLDRFDLPYVGYYNVEHSVCSFAGYGAEGNLWSSSFVPDANTVYVLQIKEGNVNTAKPSTVSYAKPVRCFKDYSTVSFVIDGAEGMSIPSQTVPNGGFALEPTVEGHALSFYDSLEHLGDDDYEFNFATPIVNDTVIYASIDEVEYNITYDYNGGYLGEGIENPSTYTNYQEITLNNPSRDSSTHFTFIGWVGSGLDSPTMNVTLLKGSVGDRSYKALYTCDYGYVENDSGECVEISNSGIKYDSESQTITLWGKGIRYTIQDRNVGATQTGAYNVNVPEGSIGKLFQWGNNYGIYRTDTDFNHSSVSVDVGIPVPSSYSGPLYDVNYDDNSPYTTTTTGYYNLWGDYSAINDWDARRGPCNYGYHVPSWDEVKSLVNVWNTAKTSSSSKIAVDLLLPLYGTYQIAGSTISQFKSNQTKFWTTTMSTNYKAYDFHFKNDNTYNADTDINITQKLLNVRCFQDYADCDEGEHINGFYCAHKLTFNDDGKETSNLVNVIRGVTVEPEEPERDGYNFEGWYENLESGDEFEFGGALTEDITLYAKWDKIDKDYIVEVEIIPSIGGNVTGTGEYSGGDSITLTATANEGYQFTGWYDESDNLVSNVNPYIFTADTSEGTGLKAVFELSEYIITTGSNDENMGTISYEGEPKYGSRIEFRASPRMGYTLQRWILNGDIVKTGDNQEYTGENFVIESLTGNVNLTGEFQAQQYSISYDLDGGELEGGKTNPETYTINSETITLNNPIKIGFNFSGWTGTGLSEPTLEVIIPAGSTGNRSYTANFTRKSYEVTLSVDPLTGGTVVGDGIYYYESGVVLTAAANEGYHFIGWYDGNNLLTGANPYSFTADETGGTGLEAKFELNEYLVTTGSNDENMGTISYEGEPRHGSRIVFTATTSDTSHKFVYWMQNGSIVKTGNNEYWTGDLVIESLTGDVAVTGHFAAYDGCNLPWGGTTGHGSVVTGYKKSQQSCPAQCSEALQTATCNDGIWSVADFETTYINSGCTTNPVETPGYILESCPDNGICSSMTGYTVNDNMCSEGKDRYRLDSCSGDYHKNAASTACDSNTFTGTCDLSTQPENSVIKVGTFTQIWSGEVSQYLPLMKAWIYDADECGYTCESGYYPDAENGNICISGKVVDCTDPDNKDIHGIYTQTGDAIWNGTSWTAPVCTFIDCEDDYTRDDDENKCVNASHTITWIYYNANGDEITDPVLVNHKQMPTHVSGSDYQTVETGYTFVGWTPEIAPATGDVIYMAVYNQTPRVYTITWLNDDDSLIDTTQVEYGAKPTHASGSKAASAEYTYTFAGWTPEIETVTGPATYKATYTSTKNKYTITFVNDNDVFLYSGELEYGVMPQYNGSGLNKSGYIFNGWNPALTTVTGPATYKAQWAPSTSTPYTVEHYYQKVDESGYEKAESQTETLYGIAEGQTNATSAKKENVIGFTAKAVQEKTILGDGSTVVEIYYDRNKHKVSYEYEGDVPSGADELPAEVMYNYEADLTLAADPSAISGYTFAGWKGLPEKMPDENVVVKGKWLVNTGTVEYTITFDTDGGSNIDPITAKYGTPLQEPTPPEKLGYMFNGWNPAFPNTMPNWDITLKAMWKYNGQSGGGASGGGGTSRSDASQKYGLDGDDEEIIPQMEYLSGDGQQSVEVLSAYEWARKYNITTMDSIKKANPEGYLRRGHLAKMVVNYMVNVLGRKVPDITYQCANWKDNPSEWESDEIRDYATKACALGIMGTNMGNKFKPNDIVTRAEFGTVVSRLLWGNKYNIDRPTDKNPFYKDHLNMLKSKGIMTQIDNPILRKELRERVWVVLRRTVDIEL